MSYLIKIFSVRVITPGDTKDFGKISFKNFNSHSNDYPSTYLTAAATIGINKTEIDIFIKSLDKILSSVKKQ